MSGRAPTLDELDGDHWADEGKSPYSTGSWDRSRGVVKPPGPPLPPPIGHFEWCWCGEQNGHDWPGKAEGEAHPR